MFFSWSRNRSFGKGPKKRELADFNYSKFEFLSINSTKFSNSMSLKIRHMLMFVFQISLALMVVVNPRVLCLQEPV